MSHQPSFWWDSIDWSAIGNVAAALFTLSSAWVSASSQRQATKLASGLNDTNAATLGLAQTAADSVSASLKMAQEQLGMRLGNIEQAVTQTAVKVDSLLESSKSN